MSDYPELSNSGLSGADIVRWEDLGPVHREVRRVLHDAGILSSRNIVLNEWYNHWRDEHGPFGFMIGVEVLRSKDHSTFPCDVMLTIACEPQGTREDQERRILALLLSIREALEDSGSFAYVLAAADRLYVRDEGEAPQFRRSHLGFNVTYAELLRAQWEWDGM